MNTLTDCYIHFISSSNLSQWR